MIFYLLMNRANIKTLNRHGSWLFGKLESKSAMIGLHPDYDSYLANGHMNKEKQALEAVYGKPVDESRQHYLRFAIPETWSMLNKRGIAFDSSMYYTEIPGFRTGCCTEYTCFDIQYRKSLHIKERTLCFMDTSVFFNEWQKDGAFAYLLRIIEQVEKHRGDFVMLWHNSSFDPAIWSEKVHIYEEIIEYFSNKQNQ